MGLLGFRKVLDRIARMEERQERLLRVKKRLLRVEEELRGYLEQQPTPQYYDRGYNYG